MRRYVLSTLAILALSFVLPVCAGKTQDALRSQWLGAWVVVTTEVRSGCNGWATDNRIHGVLAVGSGTHRFEPGELGQVTRLDLKRSRVDIFVDLRESVLLPYQDGPFELYREATCRVELLVDLPRTVVKTGDAATMEALILNVVVRHENMDDAQASNEWNEREREPYPADYERRLAEHRIWKAQTHNALVERQIAVAMANAQDVLSRVSHDRPGYAGAFAQGLEAMASRRFEDCGRLVGATFDGWKRKAPDKLHQDGWEDGQLLAFSLRMAGHLPACFVEVPPLPDDMERDGPP